MAKRLTISCAADLGGLAMMLSGMPDALLLVRHGNSRRQVFHLAQPLAPPRVKRDVMPAEYSALLRVGMPRSADPELVTIVWRSLAAKARVVAVDPRTVFRARTRRDAGRAGLEQGGSEDSLLDFVLDEMAEGGLPNRERFQRQRRAPRARLKPRQGRGFRPSILSERDSGFA